MKKYNITREFPKGGALAKGQGQVVFVKNYWSEGLSFVYIDQSDIQKGEKGLFTSVWKKRESLSWEKIKASPRKEMPLEKWNFSREVPFKEVSRVTKYDTIGGLSSEEETLLKEALSENERVMFSYNEITVVTSSSKEEISGELLSQYISAKKEATALWEENKKTHFPIYNAVGRIDECLADDKTSFTEAISILKEEVDRNIERYNSLLLEFTNAKRFTW
jgi:hypothetical protein